MAAVTEVFMEKVCLAPHSLSIALEMPEEAIYSLEGMYQKKNFKLPLMVSPLTELWER